MKRSKQITDISSFQKRDMYRVYAKCMSMGDSAKFLNIPRKDFVAHWKELKLDNPKVTIFKKADELLPNFFQIGIISDWHAGSLWQQKSALNNFCNILKERDINTLLCAGDLTEGTMSWNEHEKERFLHSATSYAEYLEDNYPKDFKYSGFIIGNHDASLKRYETDSYDFGKELIKVRKDLDYHPFDELKVAREFKVPGNIGITLFHGNGCSNPALKQKREHRLHAKSLELLGDGADNSAVVIGGHCHKVALTGFMNKIIIGAPCFQETTPYAMRRGSINDVGGLILSYNMEYNKIIRFSMEYLNANKLGGIRIKDF